MSAKKGFTLIEIMVVIVIIGILAGTAIVNFGNNSERDVRMEQDRLTSFLREVQNKALTGDRVGIDINTDPRIKICGFGIEKSGSNLQYYYKYATGASSVNLVCAAAWNTSSTTKKVVDTFYPSKGVTLNSSGGVFFLAPSGNVFCTGIGCSLPVSITLSKNGKNIITSIDQSGRIYSP